MARNLMVQQEIVHYLVDELLKINKQVFSQNFYIRINYRMLALCYVGQNIKVYYHGYNDLKQREQDKDMIFELSDPNCLEKVLEAIKAQL